MRLTPGATQDDGGGSRVDAQDARQLCARVRAVPEKGRASATLIALPAVRPDWPRGAISLESGDGNRLKRLHIVGAGGDGARLTALIETWVEQT